MVIGLSSIMPFRTRSLSDVKSFSRKKSRSCCSTSRPTRTAYAPRLPLGGVVQHDADLLLLPEQCLGDDLACVSRSTQHDEHCEPPPRCATPSRDKEPAPSNSNAHCPSIVPLLRLLASAPVV